MAWSRPAPATTPRGWRSPPRLLGVKATVVMPEGAQLPKIEATRGYGAEIIMHGATVDDAVEYAREYAAETGAVLIHPFDHPDIVAGQGTLGLEILEQCPEVRTIAIPVGGGGVAAGVTVAVKSADPVDRRGRRAGRGGRGLPGLAGGRPPGPGAARRDHGRRHRGLPARRDPVRASSPSSATRC